MVSMVSNSALPASLSPPREIKYLDTIEAYDQWAEVYDTDGNFLQRLDTLELQTLLHFFLSQVNSAESPPKIIDLGCGTGRNTLSLIRAGAENLRIIGLEPSNKMLDVARKKTAEYFVEALRFDPNEAKDRVSFETYNLLKEPIPPLSAFGANGVISTLVLEHVTLKEFFKAVATMLRPGGVLLLTNMHSEMGRISQAGFVHPETGVKIRPTSYSHTVAETLEEANIAGFELVGELKESSIDEELAEKLGPRAKKWIGVRVWYGGCFRKK
ncbi:hypothetical protein D8B26_005748 [Coccidioides posadasii str. Silveira]|uniref:Methyltransferase small domain-containing protein n=1 Tax=Coccidioides posadasii (strain RMSCC 757 / Silveira) TaxID=443226 RepID=E9DAT0_COCPS|nr:methyltransferase small domain-containing protein [Coccidioides posadasii str. Silveira]QVM11098.1 hypothetical protein D8B26_005748 [Coccidioides posadasii str. Silveira]